MLKIHTKEMGTIATLCIQGRVVIGETSVLRNAISAQPHVGTIVLDFARVSTIDAHGLSVLLELREQLRSRGIEFRLTNLTNPVRQVLKITHLDHVFKITSETATLSAAAFRQPCAELWQRPCC
jgi:anti-anti-sigma factor